eukprot:4119673-Prorocentrum_lima.AAC.1
MFFKGPTDIWTSDERLLQDIRPLQCNGRHQDIQIDGGRAHPASIWTWVFASRAAVGGAAV